MVEALRDATNDHAVQDSGAGVAPTPAKDPAPSPAGLPTNTTSRRTTGAGKVDTQLVAVLLGGFLALIGGLSAQWFQSQEQKDQRAIEQRFHEQEGAVAATLEIESRLDATAWSGVALHDELTGSHTPSRLAGLRRVYDSSRYTWKANVNRSRLLIAIYFGDDQAYRIDSLDARLDCADTLIARAERRHEELRQWQKALSGLGRRSDAAAAGTRAAYKGVIENFREQDDLGRKLVRSVYSTGYSRVRVWAGMIQSRQSGSFDPLGRLMLTPREEDRLVHELQATRIKADSLERAKPDTTKGAI
jgi:hypothetical protein